MVASDADGDVLLYSLGPAVVDGSPNQDNGEFTINARSGQISVGATTPLDFENGTGTESSTGNNNDTYVVTVIATDPSGATGMTTANIVVADADEAPDFGEDDEAELTLTEGDSPELGPSGELTYGAVDPDTGVAVMFSLSGADAGAFDIGLTSGDLTLKTGDDAPTVDYETKKEYKITIEAKGGADSTAVATLDVTVTVTNADEGGTVMLSARQPQVGNAVTASVTDPDGGVTGVTWQWFSQASPDVDNANIQCQEASESGWDPITGADSASYTPVADDATDCLQATASYMDAAKAADPAPVARGATDRAVELKPASNDAPKFTDDEKPDGADPVEIEVKENTIGMIGDAFTAGDANLDALMYTLGGDDGDSFTITRDDTGQISVGSGTKLDYEGQQVYSLTVTATDPSGATDTVGVTVTLTDVDEPPELLDNVAPEFDAESTELMVAENTPVGTAVGTVTATDGDEGDTLTYSDDSMYFDVDAMSGEITTAMMLDYEAMASHMVTVMATDVAGASDSIDVTVTVDNVVECEDAGATAVADRTNSDLLADCDALLNIMDDLVGDGTGAELERRYADGPTGRAWRPAPVA